MRLRGKTDDRVYFVIYINYLAHTIENKETRQSISTKFILETPQNDCKCSFMLNDRLVIIPI